MRKILIFLLICGCVGARRKSQAHRAFEDNEGVDWGMDMDIEEEGEEKKTPEEVKDEEKPTTTVTTLPPSTTTSDDSTDDMVRQMLEGTLDVANLTKLVEKEHLKSQDNANRTILWIDAYYKAEDWGINISSIQECKAWNQHWNITVEEPINNSTEAEKPNRLTEDEMKKFLKETEIIDSKKRLKKLGLKQEILEEYEAVGVVFREICAGHNRILWFNSTEDAKKLGIDETSPICEPFKEDLNPDPDVLMKMAETLNEMIEIAQYTGKTKGRHSSGYKKPELGRSYGSGEMKYIEYVDEEEEHSEKGTKIKHTIALESQEKTTSLPRQLKTAKTMVSDEGDTLHFVEESGTDEPLENNNIVTEKEVEPITSTVGNDLTFQPEFNEIETTSRMSFDNIKEEASHEEEVKVYDDDIYDYRDFVKRFKEPKKQIRTGYNRRRKRMAEKVDGGSEDDWVDPADTPVEMQESTTTPPEEKNKTIGSVQMDVTDEINPILLLAPDAVSGLGFNVDEELFARHEKVGLYLNGICADYVPKSVDSFNSSSFEGVEIEGPIGVNISALEAAGVNLTELAEKLRNDTDVDDILSRTAGSVKTLGGSFILPVLNKNQYDPFSAPIVFRGSAVVVRFGIYIESMSNFQTTTMDYDMDIYLLMAWRDARLVNPYDKPILVKEEEILEKLWRPDPFFANAKQAEFHEVTFLNFLMRIFPDGLVLYETRVKITPSCNLILCKYPHDKQTCDLLIKSFAYPVETVRFEWFSNRYHAIDKNPHVKLPELYIASYDTTTCDKSRKSGTFSCLRAVFKLKRDVGFHLAQTYIPTSLALMFSWVGVWLPEEFMEGRIGVAITVLLTLSTESAGAREHLPSVSYLKAIDLWFGFITGFVFITLLQTLFVIGFDKKSSQMRKAAVKKKSDITEEMREEMLYKAKRYHKIGRKLDNFCRVFYPLCFIIFLILYYFVYTEGRQDDCLNRGSAFENT